MGEAKREPEQSATTGSQALSERYYRELLRKNLLRLFLTYLVPLILLALYFSLQFNTISRESQLLHLKSAAEHEANTLDLFLNERIVNLANLIDDPRLRLPPASEDMATWLERLKKTSDTFIDVGFFDSTGIQGAYAGPLPYLENRNYSQEAWFQDLPSRPDNFIITDNYLGLRQKPHFTIAVSRVLHQHYVVLRATLDPERLYHYLNSFKGSKDVDISIVNQEGIYQIVPPGINAPLDASGTIPPKAPRWGHKTARLRGKTTVYAYSWLRSANWAVLVQWGTPKQPPFLLGNSWSIFIFSAAIILGVFAVILIRSKKLVQSQIEKETVKAQFEHAAKLASVGELSAGIAHEINNPLAIISEEVGLIKDLMNPEFKMNPTFADLTPHLDNIHEAVFRCRDITRKLLSFVRKAEIHIKPHQLNSLLDEIIEGFWIQEMAVSNIEIVKNYDPNLPQIITDGNQIKQVFLNILNNAKDAILPPGKITITTTFEQNNLAVVIADTGKGITEEQIEKIFMPFFTTKEVGKGTGLGLSVSYSIVKSLGGKIIVESIPGQGSVFTVVLPLK